MLNHHLNLSLKKQTGVASLVVTLVILVMVTLVTFYTAKTVLMEQKVTANDYRSKQAFEAAEAGMNDAYNFFNNSFTGDASSFLNTDASDGGTNDDGDTNDLSDDVITNDDGDEYRFTLDNGSSTIVTLSGDNPYSIKSQGFSDDGTGQHTIFQIVNNVDPLPNSPANPLIAKGPIIIGGSATVYNHEGHTTIWSGNAIDLSSNNASATYVADPGYAGAANQNDAYYDANKPDAHKLDHPAYPSCMDYSMTCSGTRSSNQVSIGLDAVENDSSLGNLTSSELFQHFFGVKPREYYDFRVKADMKFTAANVANISNQAGKVIWVGPQPPLSSEPPFPAGTTISIGGMTVGCSVDVVGVQELLQRLRAKPARIRNPVLLFLMVIWISHHPRCFMGWFLLWVQSVAVEAHRLKGL